MAKRSFVVSGCQDLLDGLTQLADTVGNKAGPALYEGAKVMADALNGAAAQLQTAPFQYGHESAPRLASPEEKAAVQGAFGISRFEKDVDGSQTSVGCSNSGYARIAGKDIPVPVLVRAINSGTSFRVKQPFVRTAANGAKEAAAAAIRSYFEKALKDNSIITGG